MAGGTGDTPQPQQYGVSASPSMQGAPMPGGAVNASNMATPTQPSALEQFGHNLIHGQGASSPQQQMMASLQGQQLKQMDPNDPQYAAIAGQQQQNLSPDNGGYLGTAMKMLTGASTGSSTADLAGLLGKVGYGLYLNNRYNQARAASNSNMQNLANSMAASQSSALGGNIGQNFKSS